MLPHRSALLVALCCTTLGGLVVLAGCGAGREPPAAPAPLAPASQIAAIETHGPALVAEMLRLSFVGCVDRNGGETPAGHTLIHIRNVRYPTIWEFEADREGQLSEDELSGAYETCLRRLGAIQAEQAELICWCQRRAGTPRLWFEEVTDDSLPVFQKLAADLAALQHDRGLRLRLGAAGRLLGAGLIEVRALPNAWAHNASAASTPDREAQEDAILRRIIDAGERLSLVVLEGDRDLRDNLDRLANDDWELLTVDVQAYVRFARKFEE